MKVFQPKVLLRLEGAAALAGACALYHHLGASWLKFALLFLAPDLSAVGYAFGLKAGASCYNAAHTYTAPLALAAIGCAASHPSVVPLSLIWMAHIGFDRLIGYGLKYPVAVKDTHLSRV